MAKKLTKTQAVKRLYEARAKLRLVWLSDYMSLNEYTKVDASIIKALKRLK